VYATSLSAFYNLVMLLLCGLIFRAAAIEFRSKVEHATWRRIWDVVFSVASILIAFGIGLTLGNLIQGIPIDQNKDFVGEFRMFWNPYSVLLGITSVSLFMMHGAIYLRMKTEGALHQQLRSWVNYSIAVFFFCYIALTIATLIIQPHMIERIQNNLYLFLFPLCTLVAILNVPYQMSRGNDGWAFISSCASIALLVVLFAIGTFPVLIRSSLDPQNNSLTVHNSASSPLTLTVLLIIVAIGIPLVIAYGFYVYRLFRGKVSLEKASY
jgi:cytochrome d ubiquinol oxidase subunit II